jgi:predicted pyridoxine 5'-phosphate oxidase superfamily flavin-nucleotide-binding protein
MIGLNGVRGVEHEGEQAVQRRAGEGGPHWGSPMFSAEIPPGFGQFMAAQQLAAIAAADDDGALWSSVLTGQPGFIRTLDDRTIVLPAPGPGDPLAAAFGSERDLGMVVMSPSTTRRVRVNGRARLIDGHLVLRTGQVLGNCPKYLQRREVTGVVAEHRPAAPVVTSALDADQVAWIGSADTFFIGSRSPTHGADASHRGGMPGFVTVSGPRSLSWPDYVGNSFYMTLGNIELNPRAGLVFLDWAGGSALHLTGRCRIDWTTPRARAHPGALRMVDFDVDGVVQIDNASPLRWTLLGYSRFNPSTTPR